MKEFFCSESNLKKINQGDQSIFLEMYNFYAPKLFRHIYYRINAREAAEDMAQQVFCKTWQYIMDPAHKIDNLNAFLYKLAHNLIVDYYRQAERKNISLEGDINDEITQKLSVAPSYDLKLDQDSIIEDIRATLQQLKPEQQDLITWRFFDDLSINEIAKISGKSANSVYVGMHRALINLKRLSTQHYEK
jgi:RNA polymerase sigma-70 factor (ECF subfamily)